MAVHTLPRLKYTPSHHTAHNIWNGTTSKKMTMNHHLLLTPAPALPMLPRLPPPSPSTAHHSTPHPPTLSCYHPLTTLQTALLNFQSLLLVLLLSICLSAYTHALFPSLLDRNKDGPLSLFWKLARIGERLSPWVALGCCGMAVRISPLSLLTMTFRRFSRD